MSRFGRGVLKFLLAVSLLSASTVMACPLCGGGVNAQNQDAYIWMTVMMCLVPIFAIGGVVLWVKLQIRANEKAAQSPGSPELTAFPAPSTSGR